MNRTHVEAAADRLADVRMRAGATDDARLEATLRAALIADQADPIIRRLHTAASELRALERRLVDEGTAVERHYVETKVGATLARVTMAADVLELDWPGTAALAERAADQVLATLDERAGRT